MGAYFHLLTQKMQSFGYEPKKLMETVWAGTAAMIQNDGMRTNEQAFWDVFTQTYGQEAMEDKPCFDRFYYEEFVNARQVCGFHPGARQAVDTLHRKNIPCILATNPFFPAAATLQRVKWAGLEPEDFSLITTYENSSFCKPNLNYYRDILSRMELEPSRCLMVGNDVQEDMVAREMGMQVFLLTDCLIDRKNTDLSQFPHGGFADLLAFFESIQQ